MIIEQKMIAESWKTIPNHTRYEISSLGRVRHVRHQRILKQTYPYNGYPQVGIFNDSKGRAISICVHQLMALTFFGKKPKGFEIAHKDDNKRNNCILNLCYLYWRFNRLPRKSPILYCVVCGKEIKANHKKYCSKKCRQLDALTLVQCSNCGKEFYRKNSVIKRSSIEHGYTSGKIFCSRKCYHNSQIFEYKGQKLTIPQWAKKKSLDYFTLYQRLNKRHWPIERALTQPVR